MKCRFCDFVTKEQTSGSKLQPGDVLVIHVRNHHPHQSSKFRAFFRAGYHATAIDFVRQERNEKEATFIRNFTEGQNNYTDAVPLTEIYK